MLKNQIDNQIVSAQSEDFDVIITSEIPSENTTIITSSERGKQWLENAMSNYDPTNRTYSTYLYDYGITTNDVTPELIDKLAMNPQSNLFDIININSIVRKYINIDDMIGKTYETIESNVNTKFKLSYNDYSDKRNKQKTLEKAKYIVNDFNMKININNFLRKVAPTTYAEGNYFVYLRNENNNYVVDTYPLGVAFISDYELNGEPYLLIDVIELATRIRKVILRNKKNKALFFETIEDDIKANYPIEVYNAYINKDRWAKLDIKYSGVIRTGNLNRRYGLTPIFRSLKPTLMLDTFENTDRINSKAKAKKIIFQKLRKELMGTDWTKDGFEQMAYAHNNLMNAWKMPTVVTTAPPFVESIAYVEPSTENTSAETMAYYLKKKALALGITFLNADKGQTVTTANIGVQELIKTINKIMEQAADVLNKWYRVILAENGIGAEYAPTITINSSEELSLEIRQSLAEFMFTKLACSFGSSMEVLGIDVDDERQKRISENADGYDTIFTPHQLSYTTTNTDNKGGNPSDTTNEDKKSYDQTYQGK